MSLCSVLCRFVLFPALATLCVTGTTPGAVTVDTDQVVHTHAEAYHGVNYVAFWDPLEGSTGSREALRRAGVDIIRFPGGVPGNWYDWAVPTTWTSTTTTSLWEYAQAVGAKLMLQTNWAVNAVNDNGDQSDNSGSHQADWVGWCIDNGVDAP